MPVICPTVTAYEPHGFRSQMERIEHFSERIHIDLMDGEFTPNKSPDLDQIWWPDNLVADIHLMYRRPMEYIDELLKLKPHMVIIHFEADVDHRKFAERLHEHGIKAGLSLLQSTPVQEADSVLDKFDHALVFSGTLGEHGGSADLRLLDKVAELKNRFPALEVSWDGGINYSNAKELVEAGVEVLNVGGYIQKSSDPQQAYAKLKLLIEG